MRARWLLATCLAFGVFACGLSVVSEAGGDAGTSDEGGASSTSTSSTSSTSSSGSSGVLDCDSSLTGTTVVLPPAGAACPPGTTEQTVQTAPEAQAGACSCGACTPTSAPSCAGANFTWAWGSTTACASGPQDYDVTADNACVAIFGSNTTIAQYNTWARVPTKGACTASTVADVTKVTTTAVRQCVPDANASFCPTTGGGQRACVPADPTGACSGVFSAPLVVGDGATVTCGDCGCTHTATACNVEYHDNTTCTNKKLERPADGQCIPTGQPSVRSIKVYPTNVACTPTPGASKASLTNERVLCCTP